MSRRTFRPDYEIEGPFTYHRRFLRRRPSWPVFWISLATTVLLFAVAAAFIVLY